MIRKKDREIYEDFIRMCPYVKGEIKSWFTNEYSELFAELNDGSAYRYDYITKTFGWFKSMDELLDSPQDETEWRKCFARRLYKKMVMKGITQDVLAWKTGVSQATLSKYISGQVMPGVFKLQKIAKVLGCDINELIDFE